MIDERLKTARLILRSAERLVKFLQVEEKKRHGIDPSPTISLEDCRIAVEVERRMLASRIATIPEKKDDSVKDVVNRIQADMNKSKQ